MGVYFVCGVYCFHVVRDSVTPTSFPLSILRTNWWTNFSGAFILTRSRLVFLRVNFRKFITQLALDWCQNFVSAQYLENNLMEFYQILHMSMHLMLMRSSMGLLRVTFRKFIWELWPLIDIRISFPLNILRTNWSNLTKFCTCIDIDKIKDKIVTRQFSQIYNRVIALDWCQNFVSAQYPSWEQIDRIWPNFAYALILTWSRLGLLRINFREFIKELWPLIDVRISFPFN